VGATLEAEGEEALISKGWVNTRQHGKRPMEKMKRGTLTWGPGPSSDPGSETSAASAAVVAADAATPAAVASQMMVAAVAGLMVVLVED
jgi:hypothetical protein